MLKVINGSLLSGNVPDQNKNYFFGNGRHSEEEFRKLLIDSEEYFDLLKDRLAKSKATKDAVKSLKDYCIYPRVNANAIYVERPVTVYKFLWGYFYNNIDGRHRFYVAKKYKLDIVVDVVKPANSVSFFDGLRILIADFLK